MTPEARLFEEAKKKKLWFFCAYQQLWFSPESLEKEQAGGRCRWGAENWRLRDPCERLQELKKNAEDAKLVAEDFERELET